MWWVRRIGPSSMSHCFANYIAIKGFIAMSRWGKKGSLLFGADRVTHVSLVSGFQIRTWFNFRCVSYRMMFLLANNDLQLPLFA